MRWQIAEARSKTIETMKVSLKTAFSILDGRLSTDIGDVYKMLNYIYDENFMTLECDENLYDDDHLNENHMEEEKVAIHPTKVKQSFIDLQNYKNAESKPKKESVNDTIPDFGFIGKEENQSRVSNRKKQQATKVSVTKNDKPSNKLK